MESSGKKKFLSARVKIIPKGLFMTILTCSGMLGNYYYNGTCSGFIC